MAQQKCGEIPQIEQIVLENWVVLVLLPHSETFLRAFQVSRPKHWCLIFKVGDKSLLAKKSDPSLQFKRLFFGQREYVPSLRNKRHAG